MSNPEAATVFFDACKTGKGWNVFREWYEELATFTCQASVLADANSLEANRKRMKGLSTRTPDNRYALRSFAVCEARGTAVATAEFRGPETVNGEHVVSTGKAVVFDYAPLMPLENGKITRATEIWKGTHALNALGWA